MNFNPDAGTDYYYARAGLTDMLSTKWKDYPVKINEIPAIAQANIFPNPNTGDFTIRLDQYYEHIAVSIYCMCKGRRKSME